MIVGIEHFGLGARAGRAETHVDQSARRAPVRERRWSSCRGSPAGRAARRCSRSANISGRTSTSERIGQKPETIVAGLDQDAGAAPSRPCRARPRCAMRSSASRRASACLRNSRLRFFQSVMSSPSATAVLPVRRHAYAICLSHQSRLALSEADGGVERSASPIGWSEPMAGAARMVGNVSFLDRVPGWKSRSRRRRSAGQALRKRSCNDPGNRWRCRSREPTK